MPQSRAGYIIDREVEPWKMAFFHGPTSMIQFKQKNQLTKPLGTSLGVNQMWIGRIDHAPKNKCVGFFHMFKKDQF